MKKTGFSRRSFLKGSALTGAGLAFPTIVPSTVFGANAPSNRITMAAIGIGGMGTSNLRAFLRRNDVQLIAACDVDKNHLNNAANLINKRNGNKDCHQYGDFRKLFANEKPDTVSIALPDQWHALVATAAAKAGCDIYGEKPLARSINEGRAICNAVHRYNRVWQTGSWQRSRRNFHLASQLVRNGRIGKIKYVEVGLPRAKEPRPVQPPSAPPRELDWNMWLGPAPWRPYTPFSNRGVHFHWRWILDYSGGQLTDWAGHHIDIAHWGLGLDKTGPRTIEGHADYPINTQYDVPTKFGFTCTYADGLVIKVSDQFHMGTKWYGENGKWVQVWRGGIKASDSAILREKMGPGDDPLYLSRDHHGNFIDCVKNRKTTITPVETAHRSISVGLLGEIAMMTGRKINWDPKTELIANDPKASALLGRAYREPWVI
jgi:predicted dehydrogenase